VASFGDSSVSAVNFGGSVLRSDRVTPVSRTYPGTTDIGAGNVPYWVVTTRATTRAIGTASGVVAPVRITSVRSAQSGP
jgi:hypothetical protein